MPGNTPKLNTEIAKINADPDLRKSMLKGIGELLKKHGITDTDGLYDDPSKVLRGNSESSVIITITS